MIKSIDDPRNDVQPATPPYGDIVRLTIESGTLTGRFTVTLAGPAPDKLAKGEIVGIGIDLGPPGAKDGTYQLFADGGERGWTAYLYTPRGFVRYPGTFVVAGERIAFSVSWSSIGGLRSGSVSAFCDWSKRGIAPIGMGSEDKVPDSGRPDYRS